MEFGVLGPVVAWDRSGEPVALRGPRHRAVLARLIVARGHVVPVDRLVDDLWVSPPAGAVSAVRTFVAALRRALEPERPARTPARLLVTEGPGYVLRAEADAVDAWRFERLVNTEPSPELLPRLDEALGLWRGPAYADFADEAWALGERSRLAELRLRAVELRAEVLLTSGRAAEAVPELDAHVTERPWREDAWRLLALALYRSGRQGDALSVLRRARALLIEHLAIDPGPALSQLEVDILNHAPHLQQLADAGWMSAGKVAAPDAAGRGSVGEVGGAAARVWGEAAAVYDRVVGARARARLEASVGLLRSLAVTGGAGLEAARQQRVAAIAAAEELGDPGLTARVIGAYDVPAIWTRSDDEAQAAAVVAAAERTLRLLPATGAEAARARLLGTIALESRGSGGERARQAARQAEELARGLDDPALLGFVLNGVFMQTFERAGLAPRRDEIGAELVALATRHDLVAFQVLGHLIRMQARGGLADFDAADNHAAAADTLAKRNELPLVGVFTGCYRAMRAAAGSAVTTEAASVGGRAPALDPPPAVDAPSAVGTPRAVDAPPAVGMPRAVEAPSAVGTPRVAGAPSVAGEAALTAVAAVETGYRRAIGRLEGAGMPGVERGLLPLALVCLRIQRGLPVEAEVGADYGPYEPWVRPLLLVSGGRRDEAAKSLRAAPDPPRDLLFEAMWCLLGQAAVALGNRGVMERAYAELLPAKAELAGAASGVLTLGPVSKHLDALKPSGGAGGQPITPSAR